MSVSVGKLVTQVNSKILEGGQDAINTARLVGSVEAIESRYSVVNCAALPAAADNTGRFIYVEDICAYRYSDGTQWTNDYDTTTTVVSTELFAWGKNQFYQLGDGTYATRCSPVREFCSATDWCQVSGGFGHTAAVKTSGELWNWGNGSCGILANGLTTIGSRCSPVREICSATDWCQVSAGACRSAAIKTSGQMWVWGLNSNGNLGDGTAYISRCSPVRERSSSTNWCQVSTGGPHSSAVKTSGEIWSWGNNSGGRLGDGRSSSRCSPVREFCCATDWCQVGAGFAHTSAIKTSGELWSWGSNLFGMLGIGAGYTNTCSPVREFCSATDWCQLSVGYRGTAAIKTSGQIWGWGAFRGDGTTTTRCSPVREFCSATDWCQLSVGCCHILAIKTSGELWAWGDNSCGQLSDGTTTSRCSPVREITSATDWCLVSSAYGHTSAIKALVKGFNEP